jgi:hypothetical protein
VRRSRRYKDKQRIDLDIETYPLPGESFVQFRAQTLTADDQRRRARKGWRNWYINRGRLPLEGDEKIERQLSWRRVH